ncbi:MAG: hypothetical protein PHW95_01980 [Patescibacteria group bacterium]|nr:hypothetical protein [Patescibacteria group bacterium]
MSVTKRKLIVFIGKPGVGKTTLIKAVFPDQIFIDVLPFIEKFRLPDASIPEEKTIIAYENMYRYLERVDSDFVVLELGTNHPEFNINQLKKLQTLYDLKIFLCLASVLTCWERARARGMRHTTEAFQARMARDFPASHEKLLHAAGLNYQLVDMEQPLAVTAAVVLS